MASANTSEWRQLRPDGTAKLDNLISKTDICVIVPKAAWPTHIGEYRLGISTNTRLSKRDHTQTTEMSLS